MSTTEAVETDAGTIEFVDELPKVSRQREGGGKWAEKLEPLVENQGKWAKVFGPTSNPHATVNNLRSGNVATGDLDMDEFSFAGRILGTHTELEEDEDGNEVEVEVKEGYVFARYDTPEQRAEREEAQAKRAAARAASQAANSESDEE